MFFVYNGRKVKKEEALVLICDPALFADFRIYETLRIEEGRVVFLEDHIDRILNSAKIIGLHLSCTAADIKNWINQCIRANQSDFAIYRLIVHGDAVNNQASEVFVYPEDFKQPTSKEREEGIKAVTFVGERIYHSAKTISRLTQFRAARYAKENDAFEAILVGENGRVHEGVRSNIFIVKDGKVITPSLDTVLPGIRRRYIIELAKKRGLKVEERSVPKNELYDADELFITSTILELALVGKIDEHRLPRSGSVYNKLYQDFQALKADYLNEKITVS